MVTQMTLNSIDWNDKIIILENNEIKIIEIGRFIDKKIQFNKKTQYLGNNKNDEKGDIYYLDTKNENIYTISVNETGKIKWNKVEALTKHLPINKDGTNNLLRIRTRLGRTITATKAKSFLTRINNKILPIRGDNLNVGIKIPIMMNYPEPFNILNKFDLKKIFSKNKYIYGSEIEKARIFRQKCKNLKQNNWFSGYNGQEFIVPYSRGDSLLKVLEGKIKQIYKNGCIYPRKGKDMIAEIPESITLDEDFGFYIGAILAEGLITNNYVCVSNNDEKYRNKIIDFCDKYKIGYHITIQNDKIKEGWTSTDMRLHSVILAKMTNYICGNGAENKYVPNFAYNGPKKFIKELLNSYFSGDGTISIDKKYISCTSVSEKLIDGIILLLTRFGIISKKSKPAKIKENNRGSKNIKQHYVLTIRNENIHRFQKEIKLVIENKQKKIDELLKYKFITTNGLFDKIPGNNLKCLEKINDNKKLHGSQLKEFIDGVIHRNKLNKFLIENFTKINEKDKEIISNILISDVYYDDIISIESVNPSKKYVYDLTVANDKTFVTNSGILMMDTFHHAGIGAMGTTTLGVPRIKELLSFSKNIKTPIMIVYLNDKVRENVDMANKIASYIKYTTLGDLRDKVDIYYDPFPYDKDSFMEKDNVFNVFYSHNITKNSCQPDISGLPWLIRIVLNKEKMLNKDITLLDIKSRFCNNWEKRYRDTRGLKKEEKQLLEKISQCSILSNNDNDKTPTLHIRFDMTNFDFSTIVSFLDTFIENFKLKGLEGIEKINTVNEERVINFNNEDEALEFAQHNVIYTAGVNLVDIRYINGIDINKTICNDVVEIYEKFGIEAARMILLHEIRTVFERAGNRVNFQHISILIDIMTNNGTLTSIDRHGLNRIETDPLARASFEKTVDQLITSAVFGEVDYMKSVSSRIMAGLVIKGGTGLCNILLDTKLLENSEYIEDIEHKYKKTFNELTINAIMEDIIHKEISDIFVPIF